MARRCGSAKNAVNCWRPEETGELSESHIHGVVGGMLKRPQSDRAASVGERGLSARGGLTPSRGRASAFAKGYGATSKAHPYIVGLPCDGY